MIEMSMPRSRAMSSPKPVASLSRLVSGSSKKTAVARKSPLEKAASLTFSYNSSGDFAYRIASLVAFNAAKVRAIVVCKLIRSQRPTQALPEQLMPVRGLNRR